MIGPGGIELFEPSAYKGQGNLELAYRRGREYGRYEANNSINWMTSCINCAKRLDSAASGYFQGERSGLAAAVRAIEESTSSGPAVQIIVEVLAMKVRRLLGAYDGMSAPSGCEHLRAEDCITPERP